MNPEKSSIEGRPARQWGRTQQTRRAILDAARDVFIDEGYVATSISQIVDRCGLSVGSVYHHFKGKGDLFLELWREFEGVYSEAAAHAVARARAAGVDNSVELFMAGSNGYLDAARQHPQLTILFRGGDGPSGYDAMGSDVGREWIRGNMTLLGLYESPATRLRAKVLVTVIVEGEKAIARADNDAKVEELIAETLAIVRRIASVD